jgi:hypothetical protein
LMHEVFDRTLLFARDGPFVSVHETFAIGVIKSGGPDR